MIFIKIDTRWKTLKQITMKGFKVINVYLTTINQLEAFGQKRTKNMIQLIQILNQ